MRARARQLEFRALPNRKNFISSCHCNRLYFHFLLLNNRAFSDGIIGEFFLRQRISFKKIRLTVNYIKSKTAEIKIVEEKFVNLFFFFALKNDSM